MANPIPVVKPVVVEDSISHQAGEGITAGMANSMETPDIFDNTAQAVVKPADVAETVPAEVVAVANAGSVPLSDVSTQGATLTTPSANINPNGGGSMPQPPLTTPDEVLVKQTVVVEDSVTHQAGDGITAGMANSMETPDIFDNSAQAVVKEQVAVVDDNVPQAVVQERVQRIDAQSSAIPERGVSQRDANLETLSDGSVDIPRE